MEEGWARGWAGERWALGVGPVGGPGWVLTTTDCPHPILDPTPFQTYLQSSSTSSCAINVMAGFNLDINRSSSATPASLPIANMALKRTLGVVTSTPVHSTSAHSAAVALSRCAADESQNTWDGTRTSVRLQRRERGSHWVGVWMEVGGGWPRGRVGREGGSSPRLTRRSAPKSEGRATRNTQSTWSAAGRPSRFAPAPPPACPWLASGGTDRTGPPRFPFSCV